MILITGLIATLSVFVCQTNAGLTIPAVADVTAAIASFIANEELLLYQFSQKIYNWPSYNETMQIYCANPNHTYQWTFPDDPNITQIIDPKYEVAYVIHGWIDGADSGFIIDTANDILTYRQINVCRVNWQFLSAFEYVVTATRNTRIAANYLYDFIKYLESAGGPKPENTTLVGHSLGAHVSGFVGQRLPNRIKKIFGLDAAGPLFTLPFVMPSYYRLDKSDAKHVVVIHTCDFLLGINIPCGHQDFYPNFGNFPHKGCLPFHYNSLYAIDTMSCSHYRSVEYFRLSLKPKSNYKGIRCANRLQYAFKNCFGDVNRYEWDTKRYPEGLFFFATDYTPDWTGKFWISDPMSII